MTDFPHLAAPPAVAESAWVAPGATVVGAVAMAAESSVWYGSVVRADLAEITIGERSNIQDGCVLHADPGVPLNVGSGVSVGHRAVLHGCTIHDDALVGMGAIVMNGAVIGSGSIVGAGSVVLQGMQVPPNSLAVGSPARVVRGTTADERAAIAGNAAHYVALAAAHRR